MIWLGFGDQPDRPATPAVPEAVDAAPDETPVFEAPPPRAVEEKEEVSKEIEVVLLALLPWAVSILLHTGVVLLTVFVVWTTVHTTAEEEQAIVPVARLGVRPGGADLSMAGNYRGGGTLSAGAGSAARRTLTNTGAGSPGAAGIGARGSGAGSGGAGLGSLLVGVGGSGSGGGGTGKGSPFAGGGGGSGKGGFFGVPGGLGGGGGNAYRIVYVIDASGSLIDTLPFVLNELKRSINELSDLQGFTVIFFQDDKVVEIPPLGLKKADADTKTRVMQWLDLTHGNIIPGGMTTPMAAVKKALSYRPQLLFILSDNITGRGRYEKDQKELLADIAKANVGGTKINTIQFLYPDPLTQYKDAQGRAFRGTLDMISESTGGVYKFVDGGELGLR